MIDRLFEFYKSKIYTKDKLYFKFYDFMKKEKSDEEYFNFFNDNIKYFVYLNHNPWCLYFFSPLSQKIPDNQYYRLLLIVDKFINNNKLDFSLNDKVFVHGIKRTLFDVVVHWGMFPFIDSNYTKEYILRMKNLGLNPTKEDVEDIRDLLDKCSSTCLDNNYEWNLAEFDKIYNYVFSQDSKSRNVLF